jgi:hypothetical protein
MCHAEVSIDQLNKFKVGIVMVSFTHNPLPLFSSATSKIHLLHWYIHHHGSSFRNTQRLIDGFRTVNMPAKITLHMLNRGLAASWNDGIHDALCDCCDLILVVNDDIVFADDGVDQLVSFATQSSSDIIFTYGIESRFKGVTLEDDICRSQDFACFCIKRKAIVKIGYFDENFFPAYFEDTDYWYRINAAGVTVDTFKIPIIFHQRSSSTDKVGVFAEQINYFFSMNAKYFERKWGNDRSRYSHPFNDGSIGYNISYECRKTPYGLWYDRELSVLDFLETSAIDVLHIDCDLSESKVEYINSLRTESHIRHVANTNGRLLCSEVPVSIDRGSIFELSVEFDLMPDLGLITAEAVDITSFLKGLDCIPLFLSYHWYDILGDCVIFEGIRSSFNFSRFLSSGCGSHCIKVLAPENPGCYSLYITMVHEGVSWLDTHGLKPFVSHEISVM